MSYLLTLILAPVLRLPWLELVFWLSVYISWTSLRCFWVVFQEL